MYAHESTCTSCGDNFVVEVRPGDAMRPRGMCNSCIALEKERRNRQMLKWGLFIGVPLLIVLAIAASCG